MTTAILAAPSQGAMQVALIWRLHGGDIEVPVVEVDEGRLALAFFVDLERAGVFMEAAEEWSPRHGWEAAMVGAEGLITIAEEKGVEWAALIDEPGDYSEALVATVHRWAELIRNPEA